MPDMTKRLQKLVAKMRKQAVHYDEQYREETKRERHVIAAQAAGICSGLKLGVAYLESALNAEPPGSVAGDEYDLAAREWWERMYPLSFDPHTQEQAEENIRRLAARFRVVGGSREAELETALRACKDWIIQYAVHHNVRGRCSDGNGSKCGLNEAKTLACETLAAARAKQGKETR